MKNSENLKVAVLATKEKNNGKIILSGKISNGESSETLFYLLNAISDKNNDSAVQEIEKTIKKISSDLPALNIDTFEEIIHNINKTINAKYKDSENFSFDAVIGLLDGKNIHLSAIGNIPGYLIRAGKITSITENLTQKTSGNTFQNITSGKIVEGDKIIISTNSLYDALSLDRVRKMTELFPVVLALKELYKMLKGNKVKTVNVVLIESADPSIDYPSEPFLMYLDEKIDTPIEKASKAISPITKKIIQNIGSGSNKLWQYIHKTGTWIFSRLKNISSQKSKQKNNTKPQKNSNIGKISFSIDKVSHGATTGRLKIKSYRKNNKFDFSKIAEFLLVLIKKISKLFEKQNRRYLYAVLIVFVVLFGYLKIRSNNQNREEYNKRQEIAAAYDKAVDAFNQSKEDIGLGREGGEDKLIEALALAQTAKEDLGTKEKATALEKEIQQKIDEISKTVRLYDQTPVLTFKTPIEKSVLAGSTLYAISDENKIYLTDLRELEPRLVGSLGEDLGKVISLSYSESLETIFALTEKNRVYSFDIKTETGKEITPDSSSFPPSLAISTYSTNLYLLSPKNDAVYRFSKNETGFNAGTDYISTDIVTLKNALDITIDGNIYILSDDIKVHKYTRGSYNQDFSLATLPNISPAINDPKDLYTDQDSSYLFLLDQDPSRILKFEKTGTFANQYVINGVNIDQFVMNPRVQKIWALSGQDLYELDI